MVTKMQKLTLNFLHNISTLFADARVLPNFMSKTGWRKLFICSLVCAKKSFDI